MEGPYDKAYLRKLAHKWKTGTLSKEEQKYLHDWESSHRDDVLDLPDHSGGPEAVRAHLLAKILAGIEEENGRSKLARLWPRLAAAAIVLLALGLGVYLYISDKGVKHYAPTLSTYPQDIDPGGNRAILTLADGRKIMLDDAANGELAEESGIRITKTEDGQIVYEVLRHAPQARASESRIADARQPEAGSAGWRASVMRDPATYNTIQTPKGGQYKIILPDSSVVWLNAASSLRYPTRFTGAERRVELTGEAYFQIRRETSDIRHKTASTQADGDGNKSKIENRTSKIPFIVATATQEVTVLGTQFNINAYTDEAAVKTTLVEGSVAVSLSPSGGGVGGGKAQSVNSASLQLAPNQQSILSGNSLAVVDVDVEEAVAWKNNLFIFHDVELAVIIRQIERWYDVAFEYDAAQGDMLLYGELSRDVKLSELLRALERNTGFTFKMQGRRVIMGK